MKRISWLFLAVLCSAILLNAEDQGNAKSGWVCNSKCVVQSAGSTTCDPTCTEKSGDAVFISDEGTVSNISNPDTCASHMNKHVKAKYNSDKGESRGDREAQERIRIMELQDDSGAN